MEQYDFKNEIIDKNGNKLNILDVYNFKKLQEKFIKESNYSQNTIKTYITIITNFNNYLETQKYIYSKKEFIAIFKEYIETLNSSPSYEYLITVVIKKFLKFNNIDFLDSITPKKVNKSPTFLTPKEIKKLLNITWDENTESEYHIITKIRDKLIITLLYSPGLKVSELINLTINNINFKEQIITIKNKNTKRSVLIDNDTQYLIKEYLNRKKESYNYLITNKKGNQLTPRYIQLMIKKYANKAGINKKITPTILRHSYAVHLLNQDVNIKTIQQLLGHNNLSTTEIYSKHRN